MDKDKLFSERLALAECVPQVCIRHEAPEVLRDAVLVLAEKAGFSAKVLRYLICDFLTKMPNGENWSEVLMSEENRQLLYGAEWFEVYDIIEIIARFLKNHIRMGIVKNNAFIDIEKNHQFIKDEMKKTPSISSKIICFLKTD